MDIQPELVPETTDPNLEPDYNQPEADQDDEEVLYDCRSQITEEIEECGAGAGTLLPEAALEVPRELVWGLSKDEWTTVMVEGINHFGVNTIGYEYTELTVECEVRIYFDVPLVFLELKILKVSNGL